MERIVEELTSEAILNDFVRSRPSRAPRRPWSIRRPARTSRSTSGARGDRRRPRPLREAPLPLAGGRLRRARRLAPAEGADVVLRGHNPRARSSRRASYSTARAKEPLRVGVQAGPFVSPNQREAEQLVGQELEDDDDFLDGLDGDRGDGRAQRAHHARERPLRAPSLRRRPAVRAGAARRAGVGRRVGGRASPSSSRLSSTTGSPTSRCGWSTPPAPHPREVGAVRFDAQVATAIAANVELEDPHAVRS